MVSKCFGTLEHLRSIGEGNAVRQRNPVLKRATALAAAAVMNPCSVMQMGLSLPLFRSGHPGGQGEN
ncbi:hypothetical protein R1flu_015915 [Riccia fluitans]|uniref:Uncharacterized protein n=1 Tax=Riccia fluitans TaxID=41844 RepID=A0ABD1YLC8_9MARC